MDLFGKKKLDSLEENQRALEARIRDLESEKEELSRTLEKRDEKIRRLAASYQEATVALKACERPPPEEPGRERSEEGSASIAGRRIAPHEAARLFRRLEGVSSPEGDLVSACVLRPEEAPAETREVMARARSDRGWCVFHSPDLFTLALVPPLPIKEVATSVGEAFNLETAREMMETPVIVLSAHAGNSFMGFALSSAGFEATDEVKSPVKEKHSKGGWSQKRFERLREEEVRGHADAVSERLAAFIERYRSVARYIVTGGDLSVMKMINIPSGIPVIERSLQGYDEGRPEALLDELYGFRLYSD